MSGIRMHGAVGTDKVGCQSPCSECAALSDDDFDGLKDAWEGDTPLDTDCDGTPEPEHVLVDADPDVPDLFVEIDYMALDCTPGAEQHSHRPDEAMLTEIEANFLAEGDIELHLEVDDCIPHTTILSFDRPPRDPDCTEWSLFADLKAQHFTPWRRGYYKYALIGHAWAKTGYHFDVDGDCEGIDKSQGEIGGDDVRITKLRRSSEERLPNGNPEPVSPSATSNEVDSLLHELGHTFGLDHGGADDGRAYKPNYQSVMSYRYEYSLAFADGDLPGARVRNLSREALGDLDEENLDEQAGLPSSFPDGERNLLEWSCDRNHNGRCRDEPSGMADPAPGHPIDWSCDGAYEQGIEADVTCATPGDELPSHHDYPALRYDFQCSGHDDLDKDAPQEVEAEPFEPPAVTVAGPGVLPVEVDVEPLCASSPVALDGAGLVDVLVKGGPGWTASDVLAHTLHFQGGRPRHVAVGDLDGDLVDDLLLSVPADELTLVAESIEGTTGAELSTGQRLRGVGTLTPVPTWEDEDGDGVPDGCDLCASSVQWSTVDLQGCP